MVMGVGVPVDTETCWFESSTALCYLVTPLGNHTTTVRESEMTKTAKRCPVGRDEFLKNAKGGNVDLLGTKVPLSPREFESGSYGWGFADKAEFTVNGKKVLCQVSINITAIYSKDTDPRPVAPVQ
jgi:hypothetical protein